MEPKLLELDLAGISMVGFGRLAIIGIKSRAVSGGMQRNEVCAYGCFLKFRQRGHAALDVYSDVLYVTFRWHYCNCC